MPYPLSFLSIECPPNSQAVKVIDQTRLPHDHQIIELSSLADCCTAISDMQIRGAPLIGAVAAFGMALALSHDASAEHEQKAATLLTATRPTAVNLAWAIERVRRAVATCPPDEKAYAAWQEARTICDEDTAACCAIGDHGLSVIRDTQQRKPGPVQIMTHCNAGALATTAWGTALAPIYKAQEAGIEVHVWVSETRPRNQGAALTSWELAQAGIPHTLIADNAAGHLLQQGHVDMCLIGADRVTAQGDVCNKIGTYLKALAAQDNGVPFYAALPLSTIDWSLQNGLTEIPIEERDANEVTHIPGITTDGDLLQVHITTPHTLAINYGFDVTPASLVTGIITEKGIFSASEEGLSNLKPL